MLKNDLRISDISDFMQISLTFNMDFLGRSVHVKAGPDGLRETERVSWAFMAVRGGSGQEFTVGLQFVKLKLPSGTKKTWHTHWISCLSCLVME